MTSTSTPDAQVRSPVAETAPVSGDSEVHGPALPVPRQLRVEGPTRRMKLLALAGAIVLLAGVPLAPQRVWSNLLVLTFYLLTLGLGGALFLALANVCGAAWHVPFRRVPRAMAGTVPFAAAALFLVLMANMGAYGWQPAEPGDAGTFWFKELWVRPAFWAVRCVVYLLAWTVLSQAMLRTGRGRGLGSPELSDPGVPESANRGLSALFLVVYAVTFSLATVDWLMLLEPMWFSTIWGVYHFAGMIQAATAAIVVLCLLFRSENGPLRGVFTDDHLHDLGKLLLGFSCFWMYIWYSQYVLIWYSNLPEETMYFVPRIHGPWGPIVVASMVLNWGVPFFLLLPRPSKRSSQIMMRVAVIILVGRWVDLYLVVFPATVGEVPAFGLWEVAAVACLIGTFGWLFVRSASRPWWRVTGDLRQVTGDG